MSAIGSSRDVRVTPALPPITDIGRRTRVAIWLLVYESAPERMIPKSGYRFSDKIMRKQNV
jgi:hypothetical protein